MFVPERHHAGGIIEAIETFDFMGEINVPLPKSAEESDTEAADA